MRRRSSNSVLAALFGMTPSGVLGCSLQWITICALFVDQLVGSGLPFMPRLLILLVGFVAVLPGVFLAFRGNVLGPIVMTGGVVGIGAVLLLHGRTYPWRLLARVLKREP